MGNLCCKPSTFRKKSETDSDSGRNNFVLQSLESVEQHTNISDLCDILKIQKFRKSEGPCLKDKLQPDQDTHR